MIAINFSLFLKNLYSLICFADGRFELILLCGDLATSLSNISNGLKITGCYGDGLPLFEDSCDKFDRWGSNHFWDLVSEDCLGINYWVDLFLSMIAGKVDLLCFLLIILGGVSIRSMLFLLSILDRCFFNREPTGLYGVVNVMELCLGARLTTLRLLCCFF